MIHQFDIDPERLRESAIDEGGGPVSAGRPAVQYAYDSEAIRETAIEVGGMPVSAGPRWCRGESLRPRGGDATPSVNQDTSNGSGTPDIQTALSQLRKARAQLKAAIAHAPADERLAKRLRRIMASVDSAAKAWRGTKRTSLSSGLRDNTTAISSTP